jgi:hypothetical protein
MEFVVTNCSTKISCASTGTETVRLVCDGTTYRAINATAEAADLGDYVLVTKAGQQSVTASGAGNDVALVAADDVLLTPTDALTVAAGGAASIVTTAGAVTITAGGTTQDVTVNSIDDIFLNATDASTISGYIVLANTTTTAIINAAAGGDELTVAEDSVSTLGEFYAVSTDTGSLVSVVDGEVEIQSDGTISLSGATTVTGGLRPAPASAPPVACAAPVKGTMYFDGDINKLCICNGTAYVLANDDSTTTGCS